MKRFLAIVIVLVISIGMFTACMPEEERLYYMEGDGVYCAYNQIYEYDKEIYTELLSLVESGQVEFTFTDYDTDVIIECYQAIVSDHPEYFWLGNGYSYTEKTLNDSTVLTFQPVVASDVEQKETKSKALQTVVNSLVATAKELPDDFERILYIHDYLVNNTTYDQETYMMVTATPSTNIIYDATTAYGCLVNKKAICSGYSAAFQLLMQQLGIRCGRISGSGMGGESHEWNYVYLDGDYYYVDVTWDDPISEGGTAQHSYEYLLIDEEELLKTHIIAGGQSYPDCNGRFMNYFKVKNLFIEEYSFDVVTMIIEREPDRTEIELKFSSKAEQQKAFAELIKEQRIFEFPMFQNGVTYSVGASGLVLKISASAVE